jgi:hypothetical protein
MEGLLSLAGNEDMCSQTGPINRQSVRLHAGRLWFDSWQARDDSSLLHRAHIHFGHLWVLLPEELSGCDVELTTHEVMLLLSIISTLP